MFSFTRVVLIALFSIVIGRHMLFLSSESAPGASSAAGGSFVKVIGVEPPSGVQPDAADIIANGDLVWFDRFSVFADDDGDEPNGKNADDAAVLTPAMAARRLQSELHVGVGEHTEFRAGPLGAAEDVVTCLAEAVVGQQIGSTLTVRCSANKLFGSNGFRPWGVKANQNLMIHFGPVRRILPPKTT